MASPPAEQPRVSVGDIIRAKRAVKQEGLEDTELDILVAFYSTRRRGEHDFEDFLDWADAYDVADLVKGLAADAPEVIDDDDPT